MTGKADKPLNNPGDDPYKLPDLPPHVEWQSLAADLLVQVEPNLARDSFRLLNERRFFSLVESDAFDPQKSVLWIVAAIEEAVLPADIAQVFDSTFALDGRAADARFIVAVRSDIPRDEQVQSGAGISLRILSSATLIERSLNLAPYAAALIRRFEQRLVPGSDYSLSECFVPPKVRCLSLDADPCADNKREEDLLEVLDDWAKKPGVDHISVIGEFGQGKSTALLAFCCKWAREWAAGTRGGRIPLLIELRGKSPRRQAPDRFLAEWGDRYGLRGDALLSLIQSGRAILIFEGFDEVQDAGLRFDRFEQFKALWAFTYPGSKIVFTGRPNFFLDTTEREKLLRSSPAARDAGLENTQIYSLLFLDDPGISNVLRKYPGDIRAEILGACKRDVAFRDIAKRPSMLPVIGNQWPKIRDDLKVGGTTSAAIIRHFIDFLYARKEADLDRQGDFQRGSHQTPHRVREILRAPPEAVHRVDRFSELSECAFEAWRPFISSA